MSRQLTQDGPPRPSPPMRPPDRPVPGETASQALVRRWLGAINERDLDAMLACVDRGAVVHPFRFPGLDDVYRQHDGVRTWFRQTDHQLRRQIIVEDCRELGPGRVMATGWLNAGGGEDPAPFCGVFRLRRGLITGARHYLSDSDMVERCAL